jgi:hypothetical protein
VAEVEEYPAFERATFYAGCAGADDPALEVRDRWETLRDTPTPSGLALNSTILRTTDPFMLRSLGVEIRLTARLYEESTLWLFSRGYGVRDQHTAICQISKEINQYRAFVQLGGPVGAFSDFKFFKKIELPEVLVTEEGMLEDYIDVSIRYLDNGDDRISVTG